MAETASVIVAPLYVGAAETEPPLFVIDSTTISPLLLWENDALVAVYAPVSNGVMLPIIIAIRTQVLTKTRQLGCFCAS